MPSKVKPQAGDTLCSIAVRAGFVNCDRLRSEPANSKLLARRLTMGDVVTVPDLAAKDDTGGADARHRFERKGVPIPSVRFVHGSPDKRARDDTTLTALAISNFVADRGGIDGKSPFPDGFGFNSDGDADPDSFKVEVIDPGAKGGSVDVTLEGLRPILDAKGKIAGHEPFKAPEAASRSLKVECKQIAGGSHRLRSRYLRLFTDTDDKTGLGDQALLVTDMADGKGGENDAIEILDQKVRATYLLEICRASSNKCSAIAEAEIGADRKRVRMCFHVYRSSVGGAGVSGTTEENVRLRAGRWFRRIYAQASLSYRWVAPHVQFLDPPEANMLALSDVHGKISLGVDLALRPSVLSFFVVPEDAWFEAVAGTTVKVDLPAGKTPFEIGKLVVAALPKEYTGEAFENPVCIGMANPSCDVVIRRKGKRVIIRREKCTDASLTVTVARVDLKTVDSTYPNEALAATNPELRRIIRGAPGKDDRLDNYVIEAFTSAGLRGLAFPPLVAWGANSGKPPLRYSTIVATAPSTGATIDGSDNDFANHSHEAGHVLLDAFHADPSDPHHDTELMMGRGTTVLNSLNGSKRMCDEPDLRNYQVTTSVVGGLAKVEAISAVKRLRAQAAGLLGDW